MLSTQGAVIFADVFIQPGVVHDAKIRTTKVVQFVAADAAPGGVVVSAPLVITRTNDVVQAREVFANPGAGIVLVGNGVDPELN